MNNILKMLICRGREPFWRGRE